MKYNYYIFIVKQQPNGASTPYTFNNIVRG